MNFIIIDILDFFYASCVLSTSYCEKKFVIKQEINECNEYIEFTNNELQFSKKFLLFMSLQHYFL